MQWFTRFRQGKNSPSHHLHQREYASTCLKIALFSINKNQQEFDATVKTKRGDKETRINMFSRSADLNNI